MSNSMKAKIVVYVPESHADTVRKAMGDAGAGKIGKYSHCSFTAKGTGRYLPNNDAHPTIGEVGKYESVAEERIEMTCERNLLQKVITAMKKVHPYDEVAFDVYPVESIS